MAKNVLKIPLRTLDTTTNNATETASRHPKSLLSTLRKVIRF